MAALNLDTNIKSQTIDQPNRRTIYDASAKEILWKSFLAGLSSGFGHMLANLIFIGFVAGLFLTFVQPWLDNFSAQLQRLTPGGDQGAGSMFIPSDQDIYRIFQGIDNLSETQTEQQLEESGV